jgi:hypothetical protein
LTTGCCKTLSSISRYINLLGFCTWLFTSFPLTWFKPGDLRSAGPSKLGSLTPLLSRLDPTILEPSCSGRDRPGSLFEALSIGGMGLNLTGCGG